MNLTEGATKVMTTATEAMRSVPLAIALLLVNIGFLVFATYVLGRVAENAQERHKTQAELISSLVKQIAECGDNNPRVKPNKSLMFRDTRG
jgi:hypothetical protein